jgi:hypothetical protein
VEVHKERELSAFEEVESKDLPLELLRLLLYSLWQAVPSDHGRVPVEHLDQIVALAHPQIDGEQLAAEVEERGLNASHYNVVNPYAIQIHI